MKKLIEDDPVVGKPSDYEGPIDMVAMFVCLASVICVVLLIGYMLKMIFI